jgi:O-antigen ligase
MILRIAAIALFAASFIIVLLTDGGVYPGSLSIAVVLMASSLAIAAATVRLQAAALPVFAGALGLWLVITAWTVVQILPFPQGLFANNAWTYLAAQGIESPESISVTPGDSLYALLPISLAFMTFLAALLLFRSDRQAETALKVVAIGGTALALFAIIQFKIFPDTLMFSAKLDYLTSLTAPFVNRNTAATFYGLVLIALVVCLTLEISRTHAPRPRGNQPFDPRWIFGAMTIVVVLALALTTSRGGIGAAVIAVGGLSAIPLLWLQKNTGARPVMRRVDTRRKPRILVALGAIGFVLAAVLLFGRTLLRANIVGGDDGRFCVYPGVVNAIEDNWTVGVGPGAFQHVFPAYLDPQCGMTSVWIRAHNGYLDMALAYGVPFTVAVLALALGIVLNAFGTGLKFRKSRKPVSWGGFALLILVLIHSSVDFSMQIPGFAMSFMFLLAIMMTVSINPAGKR